MIRRIGQTPLVSQRYTQRPGAYAILPMGKRVLLTGQIDELLDIQLPGGGIDPGESTLQALHREVREEIGWSITKPRRLGAFRLFVFMPEYDLWAEKICHVYVARPVRQILEPSEPHHITLSLPMQEAIESLKNPGDRLFMRQYLDAIR